MPRADEMCGEPARKPDAKAVASVATLGPAGFRRVTQARTPDGRRTCYGWFIDPAGHPYGGGGVKLLPRDFMKMSGSNNGRVRGLYPSRGPIREANGTMGLSDAQV
jgi:hypothetical protein